MIPGAPDFLWPSLSLVLFERRFCTIKPARQLRLLGVQMLLHWIRLAFLVGADLAVPWIVIKADESFA